MTASLATATANAMANAITTLTGSGAKIVIYGGSAPANADAAEAGSVLATFTLGTSAFGAASGGAISLAGGTVGVPITVAATATGTATHFRLLKSDGTTCIFQGAVGTSGQQLNLNTTTITSGVNVTITSGTVTMPT